MDKVAKEPPATCPPPPYLRDLAASIAEVAAPAVCAASWRKLLAAGWTTETSVTTNDDDELQPERHDTHQLGFRRGSHKHIQKW
jgi:hypothetical protein